MEVDESDIVGLSWMKVPRTNQLGVKTKDGLYYKFIGFRDQVLLLILSSCSLIGSYIMFMLMCVCFVWWDRMLRA